MRRCTLAESLAAGIWLVVGLWCPFLVVVSLDWIPIQLHRRVNTGEIETGR